MRIGKRIFMVNAIVLLASIIITGLAAILFAAASTLLYSSEVSPAKLEKWLEIRRALGEWQRSAQKMPFEALLTPSYQEALSNQMGALGGEAYIVKNRQVLFSTSPLSEIDLTKILLLSEPESALNRVEMDGQAYLLTRVEYNLDAEGTGRLFILAPVQGKRPLLLIFIIFCSSVFFLTFFLLNGWVAYRLTKGIVAPIAHLKEAALKISEGDLNWEIAEVGEGEVKELSLSMEIMRIKLKEAILLQNKYDENRAFLVSSISHDLKTPVTSIIGYIDGVRDGVAQTPEKVATYLETARSKAVEINRLIDDLLLYSKLDMNQIEYHFEETDLVAYFEDCLADYRYLFERENIELLLRSQLKTDACVRIDREKLKRVIQNILDNARKYIDKEKRQVEIILRETPASVVIEMKDNGQGISKHHLPHIFDRFYRADSSRKSAGGNGLGLAIAKQIVEDHNGHIWAKSEPGRGTSILIALNKNTPTPSRSLGGK